MPPPLSREPLNLLFVSTTGAFSDSTSALSTPTVVRLCPWTTVGLLDGFLILKPVERPMPDLLTPPLLPVLPRPIVHWARLASANLLRYEMQPTEDMYLCLGLAVNRLDELYSCAVTLRTLTLSGVFGRALAT